MVTIHPSLDWNTDTGSRPVFRGQMVLHLCVQTITNVQNHELSFDSFH